MHDTASSPVHRRTCSPVPDRRTHAPYFDEGPKKKQEQCRRPDSNILYCLFSFLVSSLPSYLASFFLGLGFFFFFFIKNFPWTPGAIGASEAGATLAMSAHVCASAMGVPIHPSASNTKRLNASPNIFQLHRDLGPTTRSNVDQFAKGFLKHIHKGR